MSDVPRFGAEVTDLSVDAKNTVIASDRTGGDEQRHGSFVGGSSASEDPEIKGRKSLAAARGAAAMFGRIPEARRSRGGSDDQSSGLSPVATRSGGGSSRQMETADLEAGSTNDGVGKAASQGQRWWVARPWGFGVDPNRTGGGTEAGLTRTTVVRRAGRKRRRRRGRTAATRGTSPWWICRDLESAAAGLAAASKSGGSGIGGRAAGSAGG